MEENNEVRFLYTVCPKKPIKNLNKDLPLIRVSKSLYLTKEEVLKCLECGSVYRRFSNEGIQEKCNKYDVDRVHREKFVSKEDWTKLCNLQNEVSNLVVNGVTEEPQEEKKEEKVEEVVESLKEVISGYIAPIDEKPVSLDEVETITNVPENAEYLVIESETIKNEESSVNTQEDAQTDEIIEDTIVEEEKVEAVEEESKTEETNSSNIVVNYGKKKKHH